RRPRRRQLAYARVDRAMHVFRTARTRKRKKLTVRNFRGHRIQGRRQFVGLQLRNDFSGAQCRDMRARAVNVERRERKVFFQRGSEGQERGIGRGLKAASPLEVQVVTSSRLVTRATNSVGSPCNLMNPSAA